MKGLVISACVFVLYVVLTALFSHLFKIERHSRLFLPTALIAVPAYLAGRGFFVPDIPIKTSKRTSVNGPDYRCE